MLTVSLEDAKAGFSSLVDGVLRGKFVTITRHDKPVAALVSVYAAEIARGDGAQARRFVRLSPNLSRRSQLCF